MKCFDEQGAPTDLMNEGVLFFQQRNFRLFFFTLSEVEVTVACTSLLFSCFFFLVFFSCSF